MLEVCNTNRTQPPIADLAIEKSSHPRFPKMCSLTATQRFANQPGGSRRHSRSQRNDFVYALALLDVNISEHDR